MRQGYFIASGNHRHRGFRRQSEKREAWKTAGAMPSTCGIFGVIIVKWTAGGGAMACWQ
jgi:hypothetical protein